MKKIVVIFAAMAAVLSSCQKSELESVSANEIKDIVLNISVSNPGADDTKALVKTDWVEGDQIKIWFDTNTGDTPDLVIKYDGSDWEGTPASKPSTSGYIKAVYNNFVIVASKDNYTYTNNTLSFHIEHWEFLTEIQVVVKGLDYNVNKPYTLSCDKFTPLNETGFNVTEAGIVSVKDTKGEPAVGQANADGVAFVFATADYSSSAAEFKFTLKNLINKDFGTREYTATTNKISEVQDHQSIKALTIESSSFAVPAPEYVTIGGEFSVSATKKVHFSRGNLYAKKTGDNWTWHFYSNQYDCNTLNSACVDSDRTAQSTDAEIDLFTWGYGTWSTSPIGTDCAEYPTGVFIDWGSQIGDGSTWRTLTTEEWQYLFNVRATETVSGTSDAHYARAMVNNKCGIILLPDTYSHPSGVKALANINNESATYSTNEYDEADWIKMEQAGCVFVPAAGCRDGSTIAGVGEFGYYWSSSEKPMSAASLHFGLTSVRPDGGDDRDRGCSVRLITESN